MNPQAREIERVDLELKGSAEDVTPEMRHEHQADIDPDERQRRSIEGIFSRIRPCCDRGGPQDKLDEHESAEKPAQKLKSWHARTCRDQLVKIVSVQTLDAGRRF